MGVAGAGSPLDDVATGALGGGVLPVPLEPTGDEAGGEAEAAGHGHSGKGGAHRASQDDLKHSPKIHRSMKTAGVRVRLACVYSRGTFHKETGTEENVT